ncbi:MAG: DCC1-like thiol-disulfide oxidoreductase family protein [Corynebacterium sp.]|nr:DCC1-like thiol-disulfide oxidoreductase family protein [Corynebacterium sp.]
MNAAGTDTFYYDGNCQFCKYSAEALKKITTAGLNIEPATPTSPLPKQVTDDIANQAVARVGGRYSYGPQAIGNVLRVYGKNTVFRLVGRTLATRALEPVFLRIYYYISDNRGRLSEIIKTRALKKLKRQK